MANKRISELTSANALTLNDLLALVNESQTKKTTLSAFITFVAAQQQFAELDGEGKVLMSQLPESMIGALLYKSTWNATNNTPILPTPSVNNVGWYYVVGTAGTTTVNGNSSWAVGDWLISNGEAWQRINNTPAVLSWNSRVGAVVPESGDYTTTQVTEGTNKYYTATRVLAELLAGISTQNSAILGTDSILSGFGKAQGQINAREVIANKGIANGYASLDGSGKVPVAQIPDSVLGAANYQTSWEASTNTPTIPAAATANKGWYYVVSADGSTEIDGISDWITGDWIISNGTVWQKIINTDALISWNGRIGAVVPQADDYSTDDVTEATNKYYTAARVLAELLAGMSTSNTAIESTDSVLTAFGKAQGQINAREIVANKSIANGYASLDATGKVPLTEIPSSILGAANYQGSWNAETNSPTIPTAGTTNKGWYYVVSVRGSVSVNGITDWRVGDWIISNGSVWEKIDNTDAISSWNGRLGAIVPQSGDYTTTEVAEGTNKYYTAARVLAELLAGMSTSNTAIATTDSIITAFGKAQGQINAREAVANKGVANGYASLDATGKVPLAEIPASILGAANYQGSWNATTNSPAIVLPTSANKGWYYVVSVAGSTEVNEIGEWKIGDWIISNGTEWQKIDNTDGVLSWNGRLGVVVPQSGDYTTTIVTEGTNKYYTAARVLAEVLTGLSTATTAISATDSVLVALGKAQGQITARELASNKGIASGYASLDSGGKVPKAQLPKGAVSLALDFSGYAVGAVTTEVVMNSKQITSGTLASGDQLNISAWLGLNNGGSAKTFRVYLSTLAGTAGSAVPGGTTLIGTYTVTTNAASVKFEREVSFLSNTTMKAGVAAATSSLIGDNTSTLDAAITIPSVSNGFHVIITGQKVASGDTLRFERFALTAFLQ